MKETRLFFVVDRPDVAEEIFATQEEAEMHYQTLRSGARMRVCIVRHSFLETGTAAQGEWNYDDYSDTFEEVKTIKVWE